MKLKTMLITLCLLMSLSSNLFAESSNVATVLLLRGKVTAKLPDGTQIELKADQTLPEGAQLSTAAKSFVKLVFIDKSTLNLGPSSSMLIQAFPKKEAGIIKLIQGQIRAEVTKNYMEMDDKSKSKLYIQTKSSAMGIRGTDFQVNYNPANGNSSLIVFEGKVVMSHIDRANQNDVFIQNKLEMLVSSNSAVLVKQGQISAVNLNISDRALLPTKLAPKQLDALKENKTGLEGEDSAKNKKQFRDIVPPGVDSAAFTNVSAEVLKSEVADAKSFFNEKTREYKPAAGAIIDLKTVNIIAPPPEAAFDHSTKTFVISENFGKIDEKSGQFKAPKGYELSNEGQYQVVTKEAKRPGEMTGEPRVAGTKLPVKESGTADSSVALAPVKSPLATDTRVDSTLSGTVAPTLATAVAPTTTTTLSAPKVLEPLAGSLTTIQPTTTITSPTQLLAPAPLAPPPILAPAPIRLDSTQTTLLPPPPPPPIYVAPTLIKSPETTTTIEPTTTIISPTSSTLPKI